MQPYLESEWCVMESGKITMMTLVKHGLVRSRILVIALGLWVVLGMSVISGQVMHAAESQRAYAVVASASMEWDTDSPRHRYTTHQPSLSRDDVELLIAIVEADESQQELIWVLFEGYVAAWSEGADVARGEVLAIRGEARDASSPDIWRELSPRIIAVEDAWAVTAHGLETTYFEDLKQLLTKEQMQLWPRFERDRRRQSELRPTSQLRAESIDLIALLNSLEIETEIMTLVDDVCESYAWDLDHALLIRNEAVADINTQLSELARSGQTGDTRAMFERVRGKREALRDVNVRYAELIALDIPDPYGEQFRQAFERERYPEVYGKSRGERLAERVLARSDLSVEQIAAIEQSLMVYNEQTVGINKDLVDIIQAIEDQGFIMFRPRPTGPSKGDEGSDGVPDEVKAAQDTHFNLRKKRRNLTKQRRMLERTLMEQIAQLVLESDESQGNSGEITEDATGDESDATDEGDAQPGDTDDDG